MTTFWAVAVGVVARRKLTLELDVVFVVRMGYLVRSEVLSR